MACAFTDEQILLEDVALDYRIKSMESITSKYNRYYPDMVLL